MSSVEFVNPEDGELKEEAEKVPEDENEDLAQFDLALKKKKKKKKTTKTTEEVTETPVEGTEETSEATPWADSDRDYDYTELLDRVFSLLREKNPNLAVRKRHVMPPPQLVRVGTRKTMWANFSQMAALMHRQPEHVFSFFMSELATEGSIDANLRLIIKGRYVPKQIESLLKKYIVEYVTCHNCRNPETTLSRDSVTRLYFLKCESCGSTRSVAPIKAGFHATSRADRRAAAAANR
eukprot:TRINITY_DN3832_c0_g4_i2.p1 TRINITY_DN3832_c0_g4~~TRINITY_DN3832_c0_g4_i2.p1  ORF type:complete len:255 (-),score=97.73 TRINITY_DN3832_c0_g4_i2:132-842(-)